MKVSLQMDVRVVAECFGLNAHSNGISGVSEAWAPPLLSHCHLIDFTLGH